MIHYSTGQTFRTAKGRTIMVMRPLGNDEYVFVAFIEVDKKNIYVFIDTGSKLREVLDSSQQRGPADQFRNLGLMPELLPNLARQLFEKYSNGKHTQLGGNPEKAERIYEAIEHMATA